MPNEIKFDIITTRLVSLSICSKKKRDNNFAAFFSIKREAYMTEYREFLTELGYDTYRKGGTFFLDLMDEVVSMLQDGKSNDEVRVLIPCIFIEHYHFYYEIFLKKALMVLYF